MSEYKPISDYGIIGNMLSAALVGTDGSIDWCCLPRFDSPSVFAAILDNAKGGKFSIRPESSFHSSQVYLANTNILKTSFKTVSGSVDVIDFMPCYSISRNRLRQPDELHRMVKCTGGEITLDVVFEPKLDYARGSTLIKTSKYGIIAEHKTGTILALSSIIPFHIDGGKAVGNVTLKSGEEIYFILRYGSNKPASPSLYNSARKFKGTVAYWQKKADACTFSGHWREYVVRSYLVLHLLVYSPTGAIIAAPTTSLPEEIGGERNWDYRYAWLRDASLTLNAFSYLGHKEEGAGFMGWLLNICDRCGDGIQIMYGIDYNDSLDEKLLEHLSGYKDSRPVRTGNAAYQQRQLDVFGEVLEAAHNYMNIGGYISHKTWHVLENFIDTACILWQEPDSGIWEIRGGPFHFVYSKLMCWVAVDRGIKLAKQLGYEEKLEVWSRTAKEIRDDILTKGWNSKKRAFTQHYTTEALDASNLFIPLYDFLPVDDERVKSTIERTIEELDHNGLLRRYRTDETDDGLKGSEGAFLWCSFWLVRIMLRMQRLEDAIKLYERLLNYSNHLGLLSEMVDPVSGEALGNFPQALTHLAVIVTGVELTHAMHKKYAAGG